MIERKYVTNEGHEMIPLYCDECNRIVGFVNKYDEDSLFAIWCEECIEKEIEGVE